MRILLAYRCQYGGRNDFYTRQMPVGLGTINAVLRTAGFDSRLANFSRFTWADVQATFRELRPRILGVSLFTFNRDAALKIARVAKKVDPHLFVIAGGPHATHLAETVLERNPALDAVAVGEGEETMLDLARSLKSGRHLDGVAGLVFRDGRGFKRTAPRSPVTRLDDLPHPAAHYRSVGVDRYAQLEFLITSRGCPARCTFCSTPEFWGTRLRYRSPGHVVEELRLLQERFGHVTVSFRDDTFTVDRRRTVELGKAILGSGLHYLWDCQSRVNAIDEERLIWMRRSGCQHIQYGVESGSPAVLRALNKGILLDQVREACSLTRKIGMGLSIYLITGVDGERAEDVAATLRLIREIRPHDGIVSPLVVYPGTALYEETKRLRGIDDSIWDTNRMEGLLVRDDDESRLAYRIVDATLREVGAEAGYSTAEREEHLQRVGPYVAPLLSAGETLEAEGETARAEEKYREILERFKDSLWGHLRLGNLREMTGEPAAALRHYRAAAGAVPRYHLAHSLMGSAYRRMGRSASAERAFLRALERYPQDRIARSGLALLRRASPPPRAVAVASLVRKPSSGLTASSRWPPFLRQPIPDGQPFRPETEPDRR